MSDRDLVWYGRAGVWIGAALLMLMAFTGVQLGVVSVIAVISVAVGLLCLLYTIPRSRRTVESSAALEDRDL